MRRQHPMADTCHHRHCAIARPEESVMNARKAQGQMRLADIAREQWETGAHNGRYLKMTQVDFDELPRPALRGPWQLPNIEILMGIPVVVSDAIPPGIIHLIARVDEEIIEVITLDIGEAK